MDGDGVDKQAQESLDELESAPKQLQQASQDQVQPGPEPQPIVSARPPVRLPWRPIIILLAIILLLLVGITLATKLKPVKQPQQTIVVNTQTLDNGTLNRLTKQLSANGPVQQQLTISPSTLFKNSVTVQGATDLQNDLTVKGNAVIQGALSAGSLSTHGNLGVGGNTALGGNLSVGGQITAASLSVGTITISSLNLSGDINFGGHLVPNGGAPSVRPSLAASNGTATISGNDTAGVVSITTGSSAAQAGEMAIITFHKAFGLTPKVQITPVNAAAANLRYYVSQSPTFFTIQTASTPSNNTKYDFNYFVTE